MNVTVPVADNGNPEAVKVTDDPYVVGFADEANVIVVFSLVIVSVSAGDVLLLKLVLPP